MAFATRAQVTNTQRYVPIHRSTIPSIDDIIRGRDVGKRPTTQLLDLRKSRVDPRSDRVETGRWPRVQLLLHCLRMSQSPRCLSARMWRPLTRAPLYLARRLLPARGSDDVTAGIGFGWQ